MCLKKLATRPMIIDTTLIWLVITMLLFGMVMVYSASIVLPNAPKFASYSHQHFLTRQATFIALSIALSLCLFRIPMHTWNRQAPALFIATLVLLVLILIPGIGKGVNGSRRWFSLHIINVQPSELMKLFMLLYTANYTVRKQHVMHTLTKGFLPMMVSVSLVGLLLMLEPDLGGLGVIVCIAMGILFLGGINAIWFSGIGAMLTIVFSTVIWLSPWRRERIFAYLNPWDDRNVLDKAYQLSHSLIAFGRGEILGVGLGASVEKLYYLPEAHTDFLLAVVGEELGFIGVFIIVLMFFTLVRRAFQVGTVASQRGEIFSALVAKGIGIWIGIQAFVNMGVNVGLLPTKGLTLPLMSYGGSGLVMNCIAITLLLRIDYENRRKLSPWLGNVHGIV